MFWKSIAGLVVGLTLACGEAVAQQPPSSRSDANGSLASVVQQLSEQVKQLQAAVAEMRAESARYREETQQLERQLQVALANAAPAPVAAPLAAATSQDGTPSEGRLRHLEDDVNLLSERIDDQYQTKVESGSKYRVRLSGLVLLNMFGNGGNVDNADYPFMAVPTAVGGTQGSFGGTLRQSQLRFEVFGPTFAGARTRADLDMDFAGGFPQTENGVTIGLARLRTATIRLDWNRTSLVAGQDAPFIAPLSPSSLATLAQPALSYAGNLWTWIPQIRVEHRVTTSDTSDLSLQAGILDPLSGQVPPLQFERTPQAGENSRQPAFAARIGWSSRREDRVADIGIGGYYSRQDWKFGRNVDAWAATLDWTVPLGSPFAISGEFYRGRALGGLGGGLYQSALSFGPYASPDSPVTGVDAIGGWAQLKYRATPTLDFNIAFGQDNPFASEFREAALGTGVYDLQAVRNRSALLNFIYRPRSNLVLSTEYRHIDTYRADSSSRSADHLNLAIGVLF